MSNHVVIHEGFMNDSRIILPRVGVGVGVGVRSQSPIHDISPFAREDVGHSRPHVLTVMDGCYADEIGAA